LLVPEANGGFSILIDRSRRPRTVRTVFQEGRSRFLIAHELAHSMFYDRSSAPHRRMVPANANEERFCDAFASALLVDSAIPLWAEPVATDVGVSE
jgi:hypothetical protein